MDATRRMGSRWSILAACLLLMAASANAGTYNVTNANDNGAGSLRQGILDANSNTCTAPCTILFDSTFFATTQTIFLNTPTLVVSANDVFIDGFSGGTVGSMNTNAFGAADNSIQRVVINGASNTCCPLTVTGSNFSIRGVVLQDFLTALLLQGTNALVTGCKIGTDAAGLAAGSPQNVTGIQVTSTGSATIGGILPAERNLISGQLGAGIDLQSPSNLVVGNYIGTNATATAAIANGTGVTVSANNNIIGDVALGNVISGSLGAGVSITVGTGTSLANNRIGTNAGGTAAVANNIGVLVGGGGLPGGVVIGGSGLANLISGNTTNGIEINNSAGANNVSFNVVGLNGALSGTIPNGTGIALISAGSTNTVANNFIGGNGAYGLTLAGGADTTTQNNFIGYVAGVPRPNGTGGVRITGATGTTTVFANSIRSNGGVGVDVDGVIIGVAIKQNELADNTGIGIDLHNTSGALGATANDAGDADSGSGNHLQNFPAVTSASVDGPTGTATLTLQFNVDSASVGTTAGLRVEAFGADTDPTNPEGFTFLQGQCFAGNNLTNATMTIPSAGVVPGDRVVLTATSYTDGACTAVNEGTSEFSPGATVTLQPGLVVNTLDSGAGSLRQAISDANGGACPSPCAITFNIPNTDPGFAGGVFTIQPISPLPDLLASNTTLDGATQTAFTGDTNVSGPEIVINGALAGAGARGLGISAIVTGQGSNLQIRNLVVNGFSGSGIAVTASLPVTNPMLQNNYIGTSADGTVAVANGGDGVVVTGGVSGLQLGGPGTGNLISGNAGNGVAFSNAGLGNLVRGNRIGTDLTGASGIPNGGAGVLISATSNAFIGGTAAGEANLIAFNGAAGVAVTATSANNSVRGNSIHDNTFLGIDLSGDLITANDAGDGDTGPNALQNFPVLTLATYNSGTNQTTFSGTLNSIAGTTFDIDWYSNATLDGTGNGEGETWLNTSTFTTDGSGNTPVSIVLTGNLRTANVVATASRVSGGDRETSEFSAPAPNLPPTANDDFPSTNEDAPVTFDPRVNDTDPENGVLQITANTQPAPAAGTVACTTTSCTFTPVANYNGPASFTYTITDDLGATATATVTITVNAINDPPVANPDTLTTNEDMANSVNVLTNDTDVDGPSPLTVTASTNGTKGNVSCTTAGVCTYTPLANQTGPDSFTYTLFDGTASVPGTVNVTITPVNDPPVANPDSLTTNEDTANSVNVITNDTDVDGPSPLTVTASTNGTKGNVSCTTAGVCTYTPLANQTGPDSFTYTLFDGTASVPGTVNVTITPVNDPPVANPDTLTTNEDSPNSVNVLTNDTDVDGPSALTVTANTNGTKGNASCTTAGVCTYTPLANQNGPDSFTYTLFDGTASVTGTVNVTITPVNDPPVANGDSLTTAQSTPGTVNVLANDNDIDGPSALTVTGSTNGTKGTVSCAAGGNCTYTPAAGQSGADSFTYTVFDGAGSATGTVNVTIGNLPPLAQPDAGQTIQNNPVALNVLANDSDPEGNALSVTSNTSPANGTATCNAGGLCTYQPNPTFIGTDSFTYTVTDSGGATDVGTVTIDVVPCPDAPSSFTPSNGATGVPVSGKLQWNDSGAVSYNVYLGRADADGCNQRFLSVRRTSVNYADLEPNTMYAWRVEGVTPGCPIDSGPCNAFTTGADCSATLTLIKPLGGTLSSPVDFEWLPLPGATEYAVFARGGGGAFLEIGRTTATQLTAPILADGPVEWYVVATVPGCGVAQSATAGFNACNRPGVPVARVVSEVGSGFAYQVEWDPVPNALRYELDESTSPEFLAANTFSIAETFVRFEHEATDQPAAFYYRVRTFTACSPVPGDASETIRVVIVPLPRSDAPRRGVNVPAGSKELVLQQVFVPGEKDQTLFFTAETDRPWLTVQPSSGPLPPEGVTLDVIADPANLPNGTFTATVIVTITTPASSLVTNATTTVSVPVSVNLVTPVSPVSSKDAASQHAMIIPSVGHLGGIGSQWQSDVRITNAGFSSSRYRLTFTPSGGTTQGVKQTSITVDAGATTALDDIIRNWFGVGSFGESSNGMLEILPLDDPAVTAATTIASSRTYNQTENGTLGQFIPAVRFPDFVGKPLSGALPRILSLQQVAQSSAFRTNVGVAEASGSAASVLLSVFSSGGTRLLDLPLQLVGGEQRQLNALLAQNGIELTDGRVEVKVLDGGGKVTAYASVVDNNTLDPLLVSGTPLLQTGSTKYVLPGVASLDNPVARWRTDMRLFNYGNAPQPATLTLHPQNAGTPLTASLTLLPGAVTTLDNVVRSLFGAENIGGAVHVATAAPSSLIVTGRTYNETTGGTFGQFIPAVTPEAAATAGGRALHVLQVEDSPRYRTNLGVAEVSGAEATVELQVFLPDSKITPTVRVTLAPNEFRQFSIIRDLGLGNVYNARVSVRVISGQGRVTAYGSTIDAITQDPTFVPGQ